MYYARPYLFKRHDALASPTKRINSLAVIAKILLASNEYNRHTRTIGHDFREILI